MIQAKTTTRSTAEAASSASSRADAEARGRTHTRERPREALAPADLHATAHHPAAHTLVTAWAAGRQLLTPQRRELHRAVDELLAQGADPQLIPAALDEAHNNPEWRHPTRALRAAYERVTRTAGQTTPPRHHATPDRVPTTTARVRAIQALKRPTEDHR